jgi:hypothetical protein
MLRADLQDETAQNLQYARNWSARQDSNPGLAAQRSLKSAMRMQLGVGRRDTLRRHHLWVREHDQESPIRQYNNFKTAT